MLEGAVLSCFCIGVVTIAFCYGIAWHFVGPILVEYSQIFFPILSELVFPPILAGLQAAGYAIAILVLLYFLLKTTG